MRLSPERRIEVAFEGIRTVVAVAVAGLATLLLLLLISEEPLQAVYYYFVGPFTSKRRFGILVARLIPYILTGLGMCFCYAANRFSLIGEGTFVLAGCAATVAALVLEPLGLPKGLNIALVLTIAALISGLVSWVPAVLRERLEANELVVSIMMNYVLLYISTYILKNHISDMSSTTLASYPIPDNARLSTLVAGSNIHSGLLIALAMVAVIAVLFYKTTLGCRIRICGANENFAKTAGLGVTGTMIIAQVLGGALSGLGGAVNVLGSYSRFMWTDLTGYGFDGLMVAVLAYKNPALVPIGAFLLAYMQTGAYILNYSTSIPTEFVQVIQTAIIIMIGAKTFLIQVKNRWIYTRARKENG